MPSRPAAPAPPGLPAPTILLFDGVCNLCNAWVNFLIDRDSVGALRFASLQSGAAQELLASLGRPPPASEPDTVLLVEQGRVFERSTAVLRTARHLRGAWPLLAALLVVPRPVRDGLYRWISRHRYRWFGRSEVCRVPTPELEARFLADPPLRS
jgi:predicted DCC family thiol-disulfide oxidoreductase YuxK